MPERHASDSSAQQNAEVVALELANIALSASLRPERLIFDRGVCVDVDGVDRAKCILCEVYCRLGALKAGQKHKIASDMLKLLLAESELGGTWRKVICLVDDAARRTIGGKSWQQAAAARLRFEVITVALPADVRERVRAAQARQNMKNVVETADV
jgi:hypothetical protein